MNRLNIYITTLFLVIYSTPYSQEEEKVKKIRFGVDFGVDFPNKQYAQFLDGYHPYGVSRILNEPITRQQIETKLNYPILDWEFSQDNTYSSSVFAGIYLGFYLKPNLSLVMKIDFSVIRFSTPLVLRLNNPQNFTGEYETSIINAREQRFIYGLGIEKKFETETNISPYVTLGLAFNYIQLERHELIIAGTTYNIMRINNIQVPTQRKIDGFGYGFYGEGGVSYLLNDKYSVAIGGVFSYQKNEKYVENLTINSAYNTLKIEEAKGYLPSIGAYIRIIWN
ncbi:hypothetical protein N9544_07970 [Flavobacteriales bacterium]|nr:hypothetical protein [Flavobacteriales bacterium]